MIGYAISVMIYDNYKKTADKEFYDFNLAIFSNKRYSIIVDYDEAIEIFNSLAGQIDGNSFYYDLELLQVNLDSVVRCV